MATEAGATDAVQVVDDQDPIGNASENSAVKDVEEGDTTAGTESMLYITRTVVHVFSVRSAEYTYCITV